MTETAEKRTRTIVGLHASNFKKITVVDINTAAKTADGEPATVVTVGGQNEAGKSTVLDAIAVVLGGKALAPKVPIRKGQTSATIVADLGDLKVTRTFRRAVIDEPGSEVVSTLEITNADGSATYKSPQSLLDRLLGGNTFHDPLRFDRLKPADRRAEVARLVGLDFTVLDAQRRKLVESSSEVKRQTRSLEDSIEGLAPHADAPVEEVDVAEQLAAIELEAAAQVVITKAEEIVRQRVRATKAEESTLSLRIQEADSIRVSITKLQKELNEYETQVIPNRQQAVTEAREAQAYAESSLQSARADVPDASPAREAIKTAKVVNEKVRLNKALADSKRRIDEAKAKLAALDEQVKALDQQKQDQLAAAPFPVTGMAFADDDVVLDGLPFEQASTARRLRASVAMALHNAGEIRVLLVKAGNDLDSKNLALLAEVAEEHGAQVWVERVADDPRDVTVFIEDGAVRA